MVNTNKDKFVFNILLQVRVNELTKKDIDNYIRKINAQGRKYSQSDFLRDAIIVKLYGERKDIEEMMVKGVLLGERIKEGWKKGKISDDSIHELFYEYFIKYLEENREVFTKIRDQVEEKLWDLTKSSMIKHVNEYEKIPEKLRKEIVNDLERID
ncbi:MAG: hypothetical protein ACXADY_23955 [Candidatus Hodarchaeales archaeon]